MIFILDNFLIGFFSMVSSFHSGPFIASWWVFRRFTVVVSSFNGWLFRHLTVVLRHFTVGFFVILRWVFRHFTVGFFVVSNGLPSLHGGCFIV